VTRTASPRRKLDIIQAMGHPDLFGPYFRGASWDGWRAVLKAGYALPMAEKELAFFRTVAERDPPRKAVRERVYIAGRGAGKDSIESLDTTFAAITFDRQDKLRPGEKAVVMCLAVDRDQSQIILGYVKGYFAQIPALKKMVVREAADGLELDMASISSLPPIHIAASVAARSCMCAWTRRRSGATSIRPRRTSKHTMPRSRVCGFLARR